jgi:hypothetical protein
MSNVLMENHGVVVKGLIQVNVILKHGESFPQTSWVRSPRLKIKKG